MEQGLQPKMVRPQLYISSERTEVVKDLLEQNGITHILQAGVELQQSHPSSFVYLQLPLYDMPEQDIVASFPAAFNFIEQAMNNGGGVLVHCQAGISRSATIVIAYCMWKERLSADAATALVSAARSVIWPNLGFKTQLREFERLRWDASKWQGWNMEKFLTTRYGDESVGFMAAMLGGTPTDRVSRRQQWQQEQEQYALDQSVAQLSGSPFACSRACSGDVAACAGESGNSNIPVYAQNAFDSFPSSDFRTGDQRHSSRSIPSHPSPTHTSAGKQSPCGGCCRATGPTTTRRMSLACYCNVAGCSTSSSPQGSSGGSNRLRRHSTGQHALAAAAAAAAGVTALQLGSFQRMAFSPGSRLPEEAALLMAG